MQQLWDWWKHAAEEGPSPSGPADGGAADRAADGEAQGLRLELAERDRVIARLQAELERQRTSADTYADAAVRADLERLFADAAGPVAQLTTQAHLARSAADRLRVADVLAVAGRLLRVLADHGLVARDVVGSEVGYDPAWHELLDAGRAPARGATVVVKFPAVTYGGKVLRKAGVARPPVADQP